MFMAARRRAKTPCWTRSGIEARKWVRWWPGREEMETAHVVRIRIRMVLVGVRCMSRGLNWAELTGPSKAQYCRFGSHTPRSPLCELDSMGNGWGDHFGRFRSLGAPSEPSKPSSSRAASSCVYVLEHIRLWAVTVCAFLTDPTKVLVTSLLPTGPRHDGDSSVTSLARHSFTPP